MTPIQQLLLGVGAKKKTYMDDVFSNYLYTGTATSNATDNATTKSINNGINFSGDGGMVWIKSRNDTHGHEIFDTTRGILKDIRTNKTDAEATVASSLTAFNNNGFSIGDRFAVNENAINYASFSFRKAKGFFDVVTYTGNGTAGRTVSHSLGSVPGCIMIKRTSASDNWFVYHRGVDSSNPADYYLSLNQTWDRSDSAVAFNDTEPTASVFTVGAFSNVNSDGETYVAYLFAGGASTAATARSVDFDGSGDYLTAGSSSDFTMGTGDFTVECWVKADTYNKGIFQISNTSGGLETSGYQSDVSLWIHNDGRLGCSLNGSNTYGTGNLEKGQWHHVAITRASGTAYIFLDGTLQFSGSEPTNYDGTYIAIGGYYSSTFLWDGHISNFRVLKGTALYTSSFRPPTEPLTNITNTKLLCCNDSSTTGSTVTPGTITANGDPTASTDSPFDDPAAHVFGASGSESVIKCGSITTDSSNGATLHLPWEPQWFLFKRTDASSNWTILDSMRGWTTDGTVENIHPNLNNAETAGGGYEELKARTIKFQGYGNNYNFIWIAIRRPDGYVGKPYGAGEGTSVFAMDVGAGSSTIPAFDSGFPVDFAFFRDIDNTESWRASSRFMQAKTLYLDETDAENANWIAEFDSNVGWARNSAYGSDDQSWMFKRHAGFDVVTYTGNGVARAIPHSLNKTPEMIWIKDRTQGNDWIVYHKGLDGGSNPQDKYLVLHNDDAEADHAGMWNDTAPTSTHFTLGTHGYVNEAPGGTGDKFIGMLFASVDGISKVGNYTGPNPEAVVTIDCGFQPRFVIIKCATNARDWVVFDTVRGIAAGADKKLALNSNAAQITTEDMIDLTSSGFSLPVSILDTNYTGQEFIYYAHA